MPHISSLRRSRGYNFEKSIVNWFNSQRGYSSRRLGGSSTGLPDIVTTHNESGSIYAIEAKSVTSMAAYVPQDQIERCLDVLKMFDYYPNRWVWLVFKFGVNKSAYQAITTKTGTKIKLNDKKRMYFFKVTLISNLHNIKFVVCGVDGKLEFMPKTQGEDKPYMEAWQYTKLSDLLVENASKSTKQATLK